MPDENQPEAQGAPPMRAQDYSEVEDWPGYFQAVIGKGARETLVAALDAFQAEGCLDGLAIDIAAGEGRDTLELLARGWRVVATDSHPDVFPLLWPRVPEGQRARLTSLQELENDDAELLVGAIAHARDESEPGFVLQFLLRHSLHDVQQLLSDEALEGAEGLLLEHRTDRFLLARRTSAQNQLAHFLEQGRRRVCQCSRRGVHLKPGRAPEFARLLDNDIIPILRKQKGFQDALALVAPKRWRPLGGARRQPCSLLRVSFPATSYEARRWRE